MKHTRKSRLVCQVCQQRPAKFAYRGHVKRDRQHVLCFACYRALTDSHRLAHPLPFNLNLSATHGRAHAATDGHRAPSAAEPVPAPELNASPTRERA